MPDLCPICDERPQACTCPVELVPGRCGGQMVLRGHRLSAQWLLSWQRTGDNISSLKEIRFGFDAWGAPPLVIWFDGLGVK